MLITHAGNAGFAYHILIGIMIRNIVGQQQHCNQSPVLRSPVLQGNIQFLCEFQERLYFHPMGLLHHYYLHKSHWCYCFSSSLIWMDRAHLWSQVRHLLSIILLHLYNFDTVCRFHHRQFWCGIIKLLEHYDANFVFSEWSIHLVDYHFYEF